MTKRPRWLFVAGLALVLFPTALFSYLTWPMPGSQDLDSIRFAWHLDERLPLFWAIGGLLVTIGLILGLRNQPSRRSLFLATLSMLMVGGGLSWSRAISASRVFLPLRQIEFGKGVSPELPSDTLIMGLTSGQHAKAYPIRLLAYHHRLRDEIDGQPIWVTFCSMCRTGKVFVPTVRGKLLNFELVGALHYNSVYRDTATGSWWYQANGKAVTGPHEGEVLQELRTDQMTLGAWLELFPDSDVLQPDPAAKDGYIMFGFDEIDELRSDPEKQLQWQWVIGVKADDRAFAYPWSRLAEERLIVDQLGELPIAIQLKSDGISYRVWNRRFGDRVLELELEENSDRLLATAAGTTFGFDGLGSGGELDGSTLLQVPATVEFRHSFERFSGGQLR